MKLGWIGLGKMGKPMSESLVKAGHSVTVYNRTKEKEVPLKKDGAASADSPKQIMEASDVLFIMISDDEAVKNVFQGKKGILAADVRDKIVINMSTVSPEISREMAAALKEKNNQYLDAPVSGSIKQANEASLVVIVGGEKTVFQKVKPLLETIGKTAVLVGDTGAGNVTKLAVNTFLGIVTQGLAEVINFSRFKDIKTEDLMQILNNSVLGSPFVKINGDAVMEENYKATFTLSHLTKDLRLAKEAGLDSPLGNAAFQSFSKAEPDLGQEGVISIIKKLK